MVNTYATVLSFYFLFRLLGDGFRQIRSNEPLGTVPVQDTGYGYLLKAGNYSGFHSVLSESSEANVLFVTTLGALPTAASRRA